MRESIRLYMQGFVNSTGLTDQFARFYNAFCKEFGIELEEFGCREIEFYRGEFCITGYFTTRSGKQYYFSINDVRHFRSDIWKMLFRTVKDYQDRIGGTNQYVNITQGMVVTMNLK